MASSDRRFGVELEFDFQGRGTERVISILQRHGYGEWSEAVHSDGSEIEVDSPILQGEAGFRELREVMELLSREGASCYSSDGGHIHHDAPEFIDDPRNAVRLLDSWVVNRHLIERFVAQNRWQSYACPRWGDSAIASFKNHVENDSPRNDSAYQTWFNFILSRVDGDREKADKMARCWSGGRADLNLSSLRSHGTVEIRLHEGTMDYEKLRHWIKFGQRFLASVLDRKRPIPQLTEPEELVKRVRLSKKDAEALLARAAEVTNPRGPFPPSDDCECGEPLDDCYCEYEDDPYYDGGW